jgi:hypothetical protein
MTIPITAQTKRPSNRLAFLLWPFIVVFVIILLNTAVVTVRTAGEAEEISDTLKDAYGITVSDYEAVVIQTGRQTVVTGEAGEPISITLSKAEDRDKPPSFTVGIPLEK